MFCYEIINKVNGKCYIGITINFNRRIKQHQKASSNSLIHKAILKYGEDNFIYTILAENLSIEEAEEMEIQLIKERNSLSPNGYNLAKGGLYGGTKIRIPDETIAYIKNHRNLPLYVLYDKFSDLMCYGYFKQIYHNKVRLDIKPEVEEYPYNVEFSCQFTRTKMTYQDIVEIRQGYAEMKDWKRLYSKYKDKVSEATFFDIYRGQQFKLIMPEVFSEKNKQKHSSLSHSGEKNGRAKLKKEDVLKIRELYRQGKTRKEISTYYPQVSFYTISDIVTYRTWKNI